MFRNARNSNRLIWLLALCLSFPSGQWLQCKCDLTSLCCCRSAIGSDDAACCCNSSSATSTPSCCRNFSLGRCEAAASESDPTKLKSDLVTTNANSNKGCQCVLLARSAAVVSVSFSQADSTNDHHAIAAITFPVDLFSRRPDTTLSYAGFPPRVDRRKLRAQLGVWII